MREFRHPWAVHLLQRLDASPVRSVAAVRLIFQTLPALNVALALSGVGFRSYLAGTLLGLPLPILVYCLFFEVIATTFMPAMTALAGLVPWARLILLEEQ